MFSSIRIAGSGNMLSFCIELKRSNMLNTMVLINSNIIVNLLGVAKLTKKQTLWDLRPKRVYHSLTHSNAPIVEAIIKQTWTLVLFESIILTMTGITKNNRNFAKVRVTQFTQLWAAPNHNFKKHQDLLT